MARQAAGSAGGKTIYNTVLSMIRANVNDMKSRAKDRTAEENERIGEEDLANAIAHAVEEALKEQVVLLTADTGTAGGYIIPPAAAPVPTVITPTPTPMNIPAAKVKNLIYKS